MSAAAVRGRRIHNIDCWWGGVRRRKQAGRCIDAAPLRLSIPRTVPQGYQHHHKQHTASESTHRQQLQQVLAAELAREAERDAQLRGVDDEGERQRLAWFYEGERRDASALMRRLQAACM